MNWGVGVLFYPALGTGPAECLCVWLILCRRCIFSMAKL